MHGLQSCRCLLYDKEALYTETQLTLLEPLKLKTLDISSSNQQHIPNMTASGTVALFSPGQHGHLIPYLAAIHASCITHDRTIAEFLPPLSHEKLLAWWKERIAEVADGKRLIFILLNDCEPGARPNGSDVVGVVMLNMPSSETGPFRGVVEKLLVHKAFRGRGGARTLISALEAEATKRGRTILLLDTETGSPAEEVYKKLGYVELGQIPKYGLSPNGELKGGTFFWKHLTLQS